MSLAKLALLSVLVLPGLAAAAVFPVHVLKVADDFALLRVEVPPRHAVYAAHVSVYAANGQPLTLELPPPDRPPPVLADQSVYTRDFTLWVPLAGNPTPLWLALRGCNYVKGVCFDERRTEVRLP